MRLYYAFITGTAGWLGVAFYEFTAKNVFTGIQIAPAAEKKIIILVFLFLGWGVNQVVNDYLGLKEDRINAPHRPMVTGELKPAAALCTSFGLLFAVSLVTWFYLEPIALIPLISGVVLNFVYEYAKGYGIWGNIVFGLMLSTCSAYGFLAAGPAAYPIFTRGRVAVMGLVWLMNSLMTFYTYFKDYEGDKAAGKNTVVVKYGAERSGRIGLISSFLPAATFIILYACGIIPAGLNTAFWILAGLTLFLEIQTGYLYFRNPVGEKTYYSLAVNFRACACGQAALIAIFDDRQAMLLFLVTYVFVGFLFDLHANREA